MALLDDNGQPLFGDLVPPQATETPPQDSAPVPTANPQIPTAAAPPAADLAPTGAVAEPIAASPDPGDLAPDAALAPLPETPPPPPNWDDPNNPWRMEAERQAGEAQRAQQVAAQMQAGQLAEAKRQSLERRQALLRQQAQLVARVGDLAPEDYQRQAAALTYQINQEFIRADAETQAVADHFSRVTQEMTWHQAMAQAQTTHGLTPDEINHLNQYAQNTDHLEQMASEFQRRRTESVQQQTQVSSLTSQLAQLRADMQKSRSQAAEARREGGADRTGGVSASPVPSPAPTSPLGLLRLAITGDANVPVRPR